LECPTCDGEGDFCDECNDGKYQVDDCPLLYVGADLNRILSVAEQMEHGILPVDGGSCDQTEWILEAVSFVWSEQARWKAEMAKAT
jgi:hypothetical protein